MPEKRPLIRTEDADEDQPPEVRNMSAPGVSTLWPQRGSTSAATPSVIGTRLASQLPHLSWPETTFRDTEVFAEDD